MVSGAAAAAAGVGGVTGGFIAGMFLGPLLTGSGGGLGTGAGTFTGLDSYAASFVITNDAQPSAALLGPRRAYSWSGPYSPGGPTTFGAVYIWAYNDGVTAAILLMENNPTATGYIATFINPTGSTETISGVQNLTSAPANSIVPFTAVP